MGQDLRGYTDAELSMFVFNTEKYYNHLMDFGVLSVTNMLNTNGVKYTQDQWDMLCRDCHADKQEREENA